MIGYYYTTWRTLEESDVGDQALAAATDKYRDHAMPSHEPTVAPLAEWRPPKHHLQEPPRLAHFLNITELEKDTEPATNFFRVAKWFAGLALATKRHVAHIMTTKGARRELCASHLGEPRLPYCRPVSH